MKHRAGSRRGRNPLRLVLVAVGVALALVGADAQQQGVSVGANVNVISGTGPDGDWTAQRQDTKEAGQYLPGFSSGFSVQEPLR